MDLYGFIWILQSAAIFQLERCQSFRISERLGSNSQNTRSFLDKKNDWLPTAWPINESRSLTHVDIPYKYISIYIYMYMYIHNYTYIVIYIASWCVFSNSSCHSLHHIMRSWQQFPPHRPLWSLLRFPRSARSWCWVLGEACDLLKAIWFCVNFIDL